MFTLLKEFCVDQLPGKLFGGLELEAAFRYQNKYVLFFTENVPHEETLSIFLLDENFGEEEKIEIGVDYTPGIFSLIDVDEHAITFAFWSEQSMKLCYSEKKKYRWQLRNIIGVSYMGGLFKSRHLTIEP